MNMKIADGEQQLSNHSKIKHTQLLSNVVYKKLSICYRF